MTIPKKAKAEQWQRVKEILDAALELDSDARAAFLSEACADDEELLAEVISLLKYEEETSFSQSPLDPSAMPQREIANAGRRIGQYQVIRELGHGGMGAVYLASRTDDFRQQVAVKVIKRGMDTDLVLERFRNERQILAALNHPNIARLLDGGSTEDGLPFLVMEYIEGEPIDEYCRKQNLTAVERLKLFCQVCEAVQFAHQHLVIHRDIKPSNILVTKDGVPKLLDFGIAKLLSPELAAQTLNETAPAMRLMTPAYASPEQVKGEPISTASDVYSLGVVLYELLTGRSPYRSEKLLPHELLRIVCEEDPEKPSTAAEEKMKDEGGGMNVKARFFQRSSFRLHHSPLRGDLDNIVLKSLHKEPERRYSFVEQFRADIERYLNGQPVLARKGTIGYRSGKFIRRNKVTVAAAVLVVVALAAGVATTIIQRKRAERRFNDVRQLANSLFEFDDLIYKLSGSTPARQLLVQKALIYLDSLAQESGNDPALIRELAQSYLRVAEVQGNPATPNLGDREGALASYRKALKITQALVDANPSDDAARHVLAQSYEGVGDLLQSSYDLKGALENYRLGISAQESAPAKTLETTTARQTLALLYHKQGTVQGNPLYPNIGDKAAAQESYQKSLRLELLRRVKSPQAFVGQRFADFGSGR